MLPYPQIDPVALDLGPLQVHWYGLAYLAGIVAGWWLARRRAVHPWTPVNREQVDDLVFYVALGVVLGGRIGYILFYGGQRLIDDPSWALQVWKGGMSFHGGFLGVLFALVLFARKIGAGFWRLVDFVAPFVPVGLGLGRLGNFINQELWGRPADVPWAMLFPADELQLARHPSQLYQFALEGVLMFCVLFWFSRKPRPTCAVSGLFALLYGCVRSFAEFFREPDAHIGFDAFGWLTRGQLLSLPMILVGIGLLVYAYRGGRAATPDNASAR
ncbi:prolipoprotein diacylglyceryl transferase [Mangrovimicrobium sediminis]|uniref:Phosphatidylglycerol--prolipoprotein diacylglyceryl transferase n=1 Tax=Mangrovimicrobium sediminis TaxID=2562682 RepID=A0A4Z0M7U3_9GAMM|nr:prolipoprotein diacylglyceryl transferase [Haliea sp. SAOS-164]TGD75762.1 prolipoprotein diacylglyceryl transferase [Haliea sp. SAOS-164]